MNDFTRISAHYSTRPTGTAEIYNGDSSDHVVLYGQKPAKTSRRSSAVRNAQRPPLGRVTLAVDEPFE